MNLNSFFDTRDGQLIFPIKSIFSYEIMTIDLPGWAESTNHQHGAARADCLFDLLNAKLI